MDKLIKRLPTELSDMIFSFYTGWHPFYEHCLDQIKNINNKLHVYRNTTLNAHARRMWRKTRFYKFILRKNNVKIYLNTGRDPDEIGHV